MEKEMRKKLRVLFCIPLLLFLVPNVQSTTCNDLYDEWNECLEQSPACRREDFEAILRDIWANGCLYIPM